MREIFLFAVGASIVGTVFFISLIELIFTIQRRKANAELEAKLQELKGTYTEQVNNLVMEEEEKIEEVEEEVKQVSEQLAKEKEVIESQYKTQIADITSDSKKSLEAAKQKAKRLEHEAKLKAEEYLSTRKQEVEEDLMNLVLSVTKKVLPEGLTYEVQKELVLAALKDVRRNEGE